RRRTVRAPSAIRTARSRRRRAARPSALDAPRLGVDVHPPVADEAAERDPAVARELDRERRRRTDGDEKRTARDRRLLHELERQPPADAEDRVGEGQAAVEKRA